MTAGEVKIGRCYAVKVTNKLTIVKIEARSSLGGWEGRNIFTNRRVHIQSAVRLLGDVSARGNTCLRIRSVFRLFNSFVQRLFFEFTRNRIPRTNTGSPRAMAPPPPSGPEGPMTRRSMPHMTTHHRMKMMPATPSFFHATK